MSQLYEFGLYQAARDADNIVETLHAAAVHDRIVERTATAFGGSRPFKQTDEFSAAADCLAEYYGLSESGLHKLLNYIENNIILATESEPAAIWHSGHSSANSLQ